MTERNPPDIPPDQHGDHPRHGRTPEAALKAADRRLRVLRYRMAGASLRQIAGRCQVSLAQVRRDLQAALAELSELETRNLGHLRALEAARVDELFRAVWPSARQGVPVAIQQALQLMERRARLYGLDAAVKVDLLVQAEMERLLDTLRAGLSPAEYKEVLSLLAVCGGQAAH